MKNVIRYCVRLYLHLTPIPINNIHFILHMDVCYPVSFCFADSAQRWVIDRWRWRWRRRATVRGRVNELVSERYVYFHHLWPEWFSLPTIRKHICACVLCIYKKWSPCCGYPVTSLISLMPAHLVNLFF